MPRVLEEGRTSFVRPPTAPFSEVIEYNVVLAPLADGRIHVALTATTIDEDMPQLVTQEIATECVATVDDVLAIIRNSLK